MTEKTVVQKGGILPCVAVMLWYWCVLFYIIRLEPETILLILSYLLHTTLQYSTMYGTSCLCSPGWKLVLTRRMPRLVLGILITAISTINTTRVPLPGEFSYRKYFGFCKIIFHFISYNIEIIFNRPKFAICSLHSKR